MPRQMSQQIQAVRRAAETDGAYRWLLEIAAATDRRYRLCTGSGFVTAQGLQFQPAMVAPSPPREDGEGGQTEAEIGIPNTSRIPGAIASAGPVSSEGIMGASSTMYLLHESELSSPTALDDAVSWSLIVTGAVVSPRVVVLRLGSPADVESVPSETFTRERFPQLLPGGGLRR